MSTDMVPEIKRVQLGLTVLKLIDLGIKRPDLFPFIESPGADNLKVCCARYPRRIYRGAVNLILFRHCPSKSFWKCTIWNINIQYKNDWYTLQMLTKPFFVFRHWENLVSSSIYPSCRKYIVDWKDTLSYKFNSEIDSFINLSFSHMNQPCHDDSKMEGLSVMTEIVVV